MPNPYRTWAQEYLIARLAEKGVEGVTVTVYLTELSSDKDAPAPTLAMSAKLFTNVTIRDFPMDYRIVVAETPEVNKIAVHWAAGNGPDDHEPDDFNSVYWETNRIGFVPPLTKACDALLSEIDEFIAENIETP